MLRLQKKWTRSLLALSLCFSLSTGLVNAESVGQAAEELITQYPDLIEDWKSVPNLAVSDSEIKAFVNAITAEVEELGGVTEQNVGAKFNQAFETVMVSGQYSNVILAAALAFNIDPTTRQIPAELVPLKEVIKNEVLEKVSTPVPSEEGKISVGGGGGGAIVASNATTVTPTVGGTVDSNGASLLIPANGFDSDIKVTVGKLSSTSSLSFAVNENLISDVFEIQKDKAGNFNQAVTITLPFDKSKVDGTKNKVAIFFYNEETKKWIKLDNVKVDLSAGKVSGDVNHFTKFAVLAVEKESANPPGTPTVEPELELKDINGHWAQASIQKLVKSGSIQGYTNGSFKPNNYITRAEFATVVVKSLGLKVESGKEFTDTKNHWAKDYVATAAAQGILSGYDPSTFGANDLITREQMAVMIAKAAKLESSTTGLPFIDNNLVSSWAKASVDAITSKGIIRGYPNQTFKAKGNATRAEAVTVIFNALK